MFTLNIYTASTGNKPFGDYVCSISQNSRKQCIKIANEKFPNFAWDWDDKNYVRNKKFRGDESTTVAISLASII
jgi:hypothetical protein